MKSNYREHLISKELERELTQIYDRKNYAVVNASRALDKPDAKSFWLPMEVLEEYIAHVKDEAKKKGYKNLGIKVKMGQYPEDRVIGPLQKPETKGYQTVCIVPTYAGIHPSDPEGKGSKNKEMEGVSGLNYAQLTPPF